MRRVADQARRLRVAAREAFRAAVLEGAARADQVQRRHHAGDLGQGRGAAVGIRVVLAQRRDAGDQPARVGMQRKVEDRVGGSLLDHPSGIHHRHAVGHFGDRAHVMGDHQDRRAELLLDVVEQLEDLRLHGDVQRRGRLVGDQQLRPAADRHRDHHPLAHAARQLVRIAARAPLRLGDADPVEQRHGVGEGLGIGSVLVEHDRLGDLVAGGEHRVERGHRLLEDHRRLASAHPAKASFGGVGQLLAVEADRAAGELAGRRGDQPHDRQRGDRLAAARFPDDAQRLALGGRQAHLVQRRDLAVAGAEGDAQVLDLEQHLNAPAAWD